MPRNDQLVRQHRIIERLRGGRAMNIGHFEDLRLEYRLIPKTIRRDLVAISTIPELQIHTFERGGMTWYLSEAKPVSDAPRGPKVCSKCNTPKVHEEFGRNKRNADGRENQCSDCRNEWRREWVRQHRVHVARQAKLWRAKQKRKAK